jgi:hypothetical protein
LRYYGRVSRERFANPEGGGVSVRTQDFLVLAVAIVAAAGCAYYYVVAVLDQHRALSRSAALAFFVFNVVAAVFLLRIL